MYAAEFSFARVYFPILFSEILKLISYSLSTLYSLKFLKHPFHFQEMYWGFGNSDLINFLFCE